MDDLFHQSKYQPKNLSIIRLIEDFEKQYLKIFRRVKTDWNNVIREFMRDSTNLKLLNKKDVRGAIRDYTVEIRFKPDQMDEFIKIIDENFPDLDFTEYAQLQKFYTAAIDTQPFLVGNDKTEKEIISLMKYCDAYFKWYSLDKIIFTLFGKDGSSKDIWGSYFFGDHRIEIYYLPLIIFCSLKNINLEFAIVTVLTHELAHAYHHIGKDKDGRQWSGYCETEPRIAEGLAQYYTERFVEENSFRYPAMQNAYETLLSCQSGPYVIHKEWSKTYSEEHVKLALMAARRNDLKDYDQFKERMIEARNVLK